jgi:hypothetical protein
VIAVHDILRPPTRDANDVYLVYELMDTDLHQIIRSSQSLSDDHFQYFIYQVRTRDHPRLAAARQLPKQAQHGRNGDAAASSTVT